MKRLCCWIDELIADESLPWKRNGDEVQIVLSRTLRSQTVQIARHKERYVLSSVIAHMSAVNENRRSLAFRLWRRNSLKAVVTFVIDQQERVIGLIDLPTESARRDELKFYLESLARECDRLEYILTGTDNR